MSQQRQRCACATVAGVFAGVFDGFAGSCVPRWADASWILLGATSREKKMASTMILGVAAAATPFRFLSWAFQPRSSLTFAICSGTNAF